MHTTREKKLMDSPTEGDIYLIQNIIRKSNWRQPIFISLEWYSANTDNQISWTAQEVWRSTVWVRIRESVPTKVMKCPSEKENNINLLFRNNTKKESKTKTMTCLLY